MLVVLRTQLEREVGSAAATPAAEREDAVSGGRVSSEGIFFWSFRIERGWVYLFFPSR
jgi:hypothetical protein